MSTRQRLYLRCRIDPTFRQFVQPGNDGPANPGAPGRILTETPRGRQIADALLTQGYIKLDDEVAALYGNALSGGRQPNTSVADLYPATRPSTVDPDFDSSHLLYVPMPGHR